MKLLDNLPGCYPDTSNKSYYFIGSIKIFLDYNIHILDYHGNLEKHVIDENDRIKIIFLNRNQTRYLPYKRQGIPECKLKTIIDLVKLLIFLVDDLDELEKYLQVDVSYINFRMKYYNYMI